MIREAILAVLMGMPQWHLDDETGEARSELLRPIAETIDSVAETPLEAAALVALGWHETKFARLVIEGRCSEMPAGVRCDNGRARGVWQLWQASCPAAYRYAAGSRESLREEARCARRLLLGQRGRCRGRHPSGEWAGAFSGYRGASCTWQPAAARAATMRDVLYRLEARL